MRHCTPPLRGVYRMLLPYPPPHPILPSTCVWNAGLLWGRAGGRLGGPARTWETITGLPGPLPSHKALLPSTRCCQQPLLAVGSAGAIGLAISPSSLPAAPREKGDSWPPGSRPAGCQPGVRQPCSAHPAAGPCTGLTSPPSAPPGSPWNRGFFPTAHSHLPQASSWGLSVPTSAGRAGK